MPGKWPRKPIIEPVFQIRFVPIMPRVSINIFKAAGVPFKRKGVLLIATPRPKGLQPQAACQGCFFSGGCNHGLACSCFDRKDGQSVWFHEYKQNQ